MQHSAKDSTDRCEQKKRCTSKSQTYFASAVIQFSCFFLILNYTLGIKCISLLIKSALFTDNLSTDHLIYFLDQIFCCLFKILPISSYNFSLSRYSDISRNESYKKKQFFFLLTKNLFLLD